MKHVILYMTNPSHQTPSVSTNNIGKEGNKSRLRDCCILLVVTHDQSPGFSACPASQVSDVLMSMLESLTSVQKGFSRQDWNAVVSIET